MKKSNLNRWTTPSVLLIVGLIAGIVSLWGFGSIGEQAYSTNPSSEMVSIQKESNAQGKEQNDKEANMPLGKAYEVFNGVLATGTIITGPLLLYPRLKKKWMKPIHLTLGAGYIALFAISLALSGGLELAAGAIEWYNLVLIAILAVTALFLLWKPKIMMRNYRLLLASHVIVGVMFAVKFLAEPLLGGKFG